MNKKVMCLCCVLLFLPFVCFPSNAAHELDGVIGRSEYKEPMQQLISKRNESNNHVSLAYLFWDISAADYSIYVGVKYVCDDVAERFVTDTGDAETSLHGTTGIELSLNGEICATVFEDGASSSWDHNRFDAESRFSFVRGGSDDPEINNFIAEVRLGVKYWIPYDTQLGIRIFDCSGDPSNYYAVRINPAPTETAAQSANTTTTSKEKAGVSTTVEVTATSPLRTTKRVIVATAARVTSAPAAASTEKSVTEEATKPKTSGKAKSSTTRTTAKPTKTKELTASSAAKYVWASQTEPAATTASETDLSLLHTPAITAQRAIRLNRSRTVAIALAASLVTAAVFISVIAGIRSKKSQDPIKETVAKSQDNVQQNNH